MAVSTTADGRMIVHVSKRRIPLRGAQRKGIQASDLMAALTDPAEGMKQSPRVEKPRVMIETMRVVGDDVMTAHDVALYEFLLAHARANGIDKESHEVSPKDMMRFLEVRHVDRIVESLERITRTVVRYDFRDEEVRRRGAMPLILAELTEDLRSGTATLTYAIPAPIRRVVLAARDFAMLEINAFAQFSCRYTGRLYQRLALRAGMDEPLRRPWEITPRQLAEELGFPLEKDGSLHYATFIRRCLKPALNDIDLHVERFSVRMDEVRGTGRGRPVEKLVFVTSGTRKRFEETKAAYLSSRGVAAIRADDPRHESFELPGTLAIGRAVTRTGLDEFTLNEGWRDVLAKAKANPNGDIGGMQGGFLLSVLRKNGVGAAFGMWADMLPTKPIAAVPNPMMKRTPPSKPSPALVIVDDPFDAIDVAHTLAGTHLGDECPF